MTVALLAMDREAVTERAVRGRLGAAIEEVARMAGLRGPDAEPLQVQIAVEGGPEWLEAAAEARHQEAVEMVMGLDVDQDLQTLMK